MKNFLIITVVALALGVALGRYTMQCEITETINKETSIERDKNTKRITTTTKTPDGTETTVTREETTTSTRKHEDFQSHIEIEAPSKINVSILVATEARLDAIRAFQPIYGLHVSKEFIGPITAGAFGLTNGIVGVSVGVNF